MGSYYSSLFSSTAHLQQTRALNKMLKSCTLVYIWFHTEKLCFWFSLKVHFLPAKKTEALAKPPGKPLQAPQASFPHKEVPSAPLGGVPSASLGPAAIYSLSLSLQGLERAGALREVCVPLSGERCLQAISSSSLIPPALDLFPPHSPLLWPLGFIWRKMWGAGHDPRASCEPHVWSQPKESEYLTHVPGILRTTFSGIRVKNVSCSMHPSHLCFL